MEKRICHCVTKQEEGSTVGSLLRRLGLTGREISAAKFREEGICLDGKQVRTSGTVKRGQKLTVRLETDKEESGQLIPVRGKLQVLYEDEDLILVNKPSGMVVHPEGGHYRDTMANLLTGYFQEKGEHVRIRAVGRLDQDTSGVMVFAKNRTAAGRLAVQKETGDFRKEYLALVYGSLEKSVGTIDTPIGEGEGIRMKSASDGKRAVTHYEVIKRGKNDTIRVRIDTGRTHQIRVHMAGIGHPLLGDPLYGNGKEKPGRAALHAFRVSLLQPFTGERICVEAPVPEDFSDAEEQAGL